MSKYDDTFTLGIKLQGQDQTMTTKSILHIVNTIYNPLGFLPPVVFPTKVPSLQRKARIGFFFKEKRRMVEMV